MKFKNALWLYLMDAGYHIVIQILFHGVLNTWVFASVLVRSILMTGIVLVISLIMKLRGRYFGRSPFLVIYFFAFAVGYILIPIFASLILYRENFTFELIRTSHSNLTGYLMLYGPYLLAFLTSLPLNMRSESSV